MRVVRAVFVVGVVAAAGGIGALACSDFTTAAAPSSEAGADVTETTGPGDASTDVDAAVDAGDGFPRSRLVPVVDGVYAIEATEVTNAQFLQFKLRFGADAGAPWTECVNKTALGPGDCGGASGDDRAVTCVDWCDAKSYCESIGRRLCGEIGGGNSTSAGSQQSDEWAHACGGPSGGLWPYGNIAQPTACRTQETGETSAGTPASYPGCQGGEPGVFDMSGNVAEWGNACLADGTCILHGGSFNQSSSAASCSFTIISARYVLYKDVGFRCCADL